MKTMLAAVATFAGIGMFPPSVDATLRSYRTTSNGVDKCQAFTPGPTNTIRNRVHGAENIGAAMAVACVFETTSISAPHYVRPNQLLMSFRNNNASGTISVTCTLLTGFAGSSTAYAVTRTVAIDAGSNSGLLWYGPDDNPVTSDNTLGSLRLGVNCTLPTGGMIISTELLWSQDDGVGT